MASHRHRFSRSEIEKIKSLLDEVRRSDRVRQKSLRAQLRRLGFYITDYATDQAGFTRSDVDRLVARGTITIAEDLAQPAAWRPPEPSPAERKVSAGPSSDDRPPDESSAHVEDALVAVSSERARLLEDQIERVPASPGLYAIYGDEVWHELGLGDPPDDRPLYVGKAEDSLAARDIKTHFGDGRTGQSTVRRSFAALLADRLDLRGMPRNPGNPGHYSNYGLSPDHDRKLTAWMRRNLRLAVWAKPVDLPESLIAIERAVLARLRPPLNLKDVETPWAARIKAARRVLAEEARDWKP
jgi:hypothetical protein